ncbi:MAG: GIY-YIG nuclease family protein [Patescibacteria group bacterium]
MYTIYVLKSKIYSKSYVGITNNLLRRLSQHNAGYHAYTKRWKPWIIIYTEIACHRIEARKREKYLKSAAGRIWLKNLVFKADVAELVYAQP